MCKGLPAVTLPSAIAVAVSVKALSLQERASSRAGPHNLPATAALQALSHLLIVNAVRAGVTRLSHSLLQLGAMLQLLCTMEILNS